MTTPTEDQITKMRLINIRLAKAAQAGGRAALDRETYAVAESVTDLAKGWPEVADIIRKGVQRLREQLRGAA